MSQERRRHGNLHGLLERQQQEGFCGNRDCKVPSRRVGISGGDGVQRGARRCGRPAGALSLGHPGLSHLAAPFSPADEADWGRTPFGRRWRPGGCACPRPYTLPSQHRGRLADAANISRLPSRPTSPSPPTPAPKSSLLKYGLHAARRSLSATRPRQRQGYGECGGV